MSDPATFTAASRVLITAAALVVVIAGLRSASAIVVPFLMAVFLAIISAPFLLWLQRKGLSTVMSLLIVVAVVIGFGIMTVVVAGTSIDDFRLALPQYETELRQKYAGFTVWLGNYGIGLPSTGIREYINPSSALGYVGSLVNAFGGVLTNALLIALGVVFMLMEAASFPDKLRGIIKNPEATLTRLGEFVEGVKNYLIIKTVVSFITGTIVTICLWLIGIDYPILWGWLAFFLNFVPYVGSIISAFPPLLLSMVQPELGWMSAVWVIVCFVAVNVVVGSLIEPRFFGEGLGLSTFVVFISLVFWGWILGPVGMLLSVPLTMLVKIAMESDTRTQWMGVLLGAHAPNSK
ncbi:MAG: AI-2E family transporter [Arenicellales bacterium WSBS_2016_MAG_OTU3]